MDRGIAQGRTGGRVKVGLGAQILGDLPQPRMAHPGGTDELDVHLPPPRLGTTVVCVPMPEGCLVTR
ncbi:hypothetical protein ACIPXV_11530 [Streptomyces libani]|uniref:hypothetical protein n=1 Tax=Streptomyces nigrescens TaxID=1920 RepID=UPI003808C15A